MNGYAVKVMQPKNVRNKNMADFCNQCEPSLGGLENLTTQEDEEKGLFCVVLCEGCGPIQVDSRGNCVSHHHNHDGTFTEIDHG